MIPLTDPFMIPLTDPFTYFRLTREGLGALLGNTVGVGPVLWLQRSHPYRVVIMDACHTAEDWDWATAFGIGYSLNKKNGKWQIIRPIQCFAGFASGAYGPAFAADFLEYQKTYAHIASSWMNGRTLMFTLKTAMETRPLGDGGPILSIPYGGGPPRYQRNIKKVYEFAPDLRFIGYERITRTGWEE